MSFESLFPVLASCFTATCVFVRVYHVEKPVTTTMLTQRLTLAAALLSGVAIISAQDLNALPACAVSPSPSKLGARSTHSSQRDPVSAAVTSSGCPATDTDCVCSSTAFLNAIAVTIPAACSAEEIARM